MIVFEDEALRDGLQMESRIFSLEEKLRLFEMLAEAGFPRIQAGSFVHPGVVPQMADTDELIATIGRRDDVTVSALVLNGRGLERALRCGVTHVTLSVSVSDTHNRKNAGLPAAEALESIAALIPGALETGLAVRAGLQCAFGCVYEGRVAEEAVVAAAGKMVDRGAVEINLADTTGMATPRSVRRMVERFRKSFPGVAVSLHLHDTRGLGLANMFAGYESGVRAFDVCAGGLGGCPFVRGASGNVPAEDAVNMFESMGVPTGIDLPALCEAVAFLETLLARPLPGHMRRVLAFRPAC